MVQIMRTAGDAVSAKQMICTVRRPRSFPRHSLNADGSTLVDPFGNRVVDLLMDIASRNHRRKDLCAALLDLAHVPTVVLLGCQNLLLATAHRYFSSLKFSRGCAGSSLPT
jgi:hypothetical protein